MSNVNNQYLSPQGYNIQDTPVNTNPFWGDDENTDPSVYQRLTLLESEVAELNTDKLNASAINNYYDKSEVDSMFNNLPSMDPSNYYTKSEVDTEIDNSETDLKAYVADHYYNETEIDTALALKANTAALNNYYTKSEIDTQQASDDARLDAIEDDIQDITGDIADMDTAVTNMSETVDELSSDVANALLDVDAFGDRLDTDEAAIANRYTKAEVDALLPDMTNYYTKTEVDNLIPDVSNYITSSDLSTALDDYYTKSEIDATIGDIQTLLEAI